MNIYLRNIINPGTINPSNFAAYTIDKQQKKIIGIIQNYIQGQDKFQVEYYAMEGDGEINHPNQKRKKPKPNPNGTISFRGNNYPPGQVPKQKREFVKLHNGFIDISIDEQDLAALIPELFPVVDPSGFSKSDYYNHLIKDGGNGQQVRQLIIDGEGMTI